MKSTVFRRRFLQAGAGALLLPFYPGSSSGQASRTLSVQRRSPDQQARVDADLNTSARHALVIGNSRYSAITPLRNPVNDAGAMAEQLDNDGFDVELRQDVTRQAMLEAITRHAMRIAEMKSVGLFYFAGHGLQLAWRNFLVPVDASVTKLEDIPGQCVDLGLLINGITKANNPMNIVVLDACRDNPFTGVKIEAKGLSQLDAPPGTLLAFATSPGNVASDGEGSNGVYTENLLKELKVPEARIEDVFKRVRLHVRLSTQGRQIPWESTSLEDDFYFLPPRGPAVLAQEAERARRQQAALAEKRRIELEAERKRIEEQAAKEASAAEAVALQRQQAALKEEQIAREELERRRRQTAPVVIVKPTDAELNRRYEEEVALWEGIKASRETAPLANYLQRYPSGHFAELAQLRLDQILAAQGEKKIRAETSANPYSSGTGITDTDYKVGDTYTYRLLDGLSKIERSRISRTVVEVTDDQVRYSNQEITDRLGNPLLDYVGIRSDIAQQVFPLEYRVGKRWASRYKYTQNGRSGYSSQEFVVVGREKIVVPAGTFDAFRIEGRGFGAIDGQGRAVERRFWVAPEMVRQAVAQEEFRRNNGGRLSRADRIELVSYKQS